MASIQVNLGSWYQNVFIVDIIGAKDDGDSEWWQLEL